MDNLFNNLTSLVVKYDNVIIVSHKNPDLDALGSSLGLSSILDFLNVKNYIFLDKKIDNMNDSVKHALSLVPNCNYINESNYKKILTDNTLLIILDTHQQERIIYPQLRDEIKNVVVLDHHIKMQNYIKDTDIFYIDSTLSCVAELIAFYSKYSGFNISPVVASIMLAGMEIDTNGFNVKITERAFEAAAYLVSLGADPILKQNLLKETKDAFLRRADYIKSSYIFKKNKAICLLDSVSTTPTELAEISESLLNFEDVEASFTIGQLDKNTIGISARSLGNIDVCEVMKQLGGGGHATNAAVQVKETTMKALEKTLKKVIGELSENNFIK